MARVVGGSRMVQGRRGLSSTAEAALTFLDGLHKELDRLGLAVELRAALVHLWWLRRRRRGSNPQALGCYGAVAPLVQQVLCQQLDPNWRAPTGRCGVLSRRRSEPVAPSSA